MSDKTRVTQGLDDIGWQILRALQENARVSFSELARQASLSVPSVIERVHKLEDAGIITGYHARVNPTLLGFAVKAVVRFSGSGTQMLEVARAVQDIPEVLEAHRMTGDTCFMAVILARSTTHLEELLDRLSRYGQTQTSIVVSTPVQHRPLERTLD